MYRVSQTSPGVFWQFFLKRLGIFSPNCTHSLNIPIYAGLHIFLCNYLQFWRSYAIRRDHPVHTTFSKCPPSAKTCAMLTFSDIFPKQLGIFGPNFTHLLHVPIYTRLQIFIRLSPTVTKWGNIKYDHPACDSTDYYRAVGRRQRDLIVMSYCSMDETTTFRSSYKRSSNFMSSCAICAFTIYDDNTWPTRSARH